MNDKLQNFWHFQKIGKAFLTFYQESCKKVICTKKLYLENVRFQKTSMVIWRCDKFVTNQN